MTKQWWNILGSIAASIGYLIAFEPHQGKMYSIIRIDLWKIFINSTSSVVHQLKSKSTQTL